MTIRGIVVFIVLAAAPLVPLALTWRHVFVGDDGRGTSTTRVRIEVALATLSFLLLMGSLVWEPVLGPDYSRRRLGTIYASLILMVIVAIVSAAEARRLKSPLAVAAIILALEWIYMAVVNSVV